MTVRAKFRLVEITETTWVAKKYLFRAEYDTTIEEDRRFAKASPNGEFWIYVDNPAAQEQFVNGRYYYFDVSPVPSVTGDGA